MNPKVFTLKANTFEFSLINKLSIAENHTPAILTLKANSGFN